MRPAASLHETKLPQKMNRIGEPIGGGSRNASSGSLNECTSGVCRSHGKRLLHELRHAFAHDEHVFGAAKDKLVDPRCEAKVHARARFVRVVQIREQPAARQTRKQIPAEEVIHLWVDDHDAIDAVPPDDP